MGGNTGADVFGVLAIMFSYLNGYKDFLLLSNLLEPMQAYTICNKRQLNLLVLTKGFII